MPVLWTAATIDQRRRLYRKLRECERKIKIGRRPDFDGSQTRMARRRVRRRGPRAGPALSGLSTGQGGAAPSARGELSIARSRPRSCATAVSELLCAHRANLLGRESRLMPAPRQHLRSARPLIPNRSPSASSISHSTDLLRFDNRTLARPTRALPERNRPAARGHSHRCNTVLKAQPPHTARPARILMQRSRTPGQTKRRGPSQAKPSVGRSPRSRDLPTERRSVISARRSRRPPRVPA
jgi:hypothetical protein